MGVFARLLRRSKATEEASAADAQSGTPGAAAEVTAAGEAVAAESGAAQEPAVQETAGADGVEIPKQQSAGEAVDNEAGEGART